MTKFPRDVPKRKVIKTLEALGFAVIREGNHISMRRQAGITRDEFLEAFSEREPMN
ncbi:MAG: hypothetical protein WBH08_08620 [Methanothrix sp.]|uniref:hypothetical protein n=1 Tax=Methanothrix sp. TaxID=90426 RepID=UPI003BB55194